MNSRQKGKRGEREAALFLTQHGCPARRGQQFAGSPDSPDVVCPFLHDVHFEVKRTKRTDLEGWLEQAARDAGSQLPVVLHRKNKGPWVGILRAEDLLALLRDTNSSRVGASKQPARTPGTSGEAGTKDPTMQNDQNNPEASP